MSPKPVNYEYNPATIPNNKHCRPNQSNMNIIELQFQTVMSPKLVNYEYNRATISNN